MWRAIFGFLLLAIVTAPAAAENRLFLVDFVALAEGRSLEDREAFNERARPVALRHTIALRASLDPVQVLLGRPRAERLDLWTLPGIGALQAWTADPDYAALAPDRARVHDAARRTLYLAEERGRADLIAGRLYWVEILVFALDRFDREGFIRYVRTSDALAARHGIERAASFGDLVRVLGSAGDIHWINIYAVPSAAALQAHLEAESFLNLAPERARLFDLDDSMLAVFVSR